MGREWELEYEIGKIPMTNAERSGHWRAHREQTKEWRGVFHLLALEKKIPTLSAIEVEVWHERKDRRATPDCGAAAPAAKAGVDGLVDAGVIPDDGPEFFRRLIFNAPEVTGRSADRLVVRELDVA